MMINTIYNVNVSEVAFLIVIKTIALQELI